MSEMKDSSLKDQPAQVQEIISLVRHTLPSVQWSRLKVAHPGADDDGLWFFSLPGKHGEVQIESSQGICPFVIETDLHDQRISVISVKEVSATIIEWLSAQENVSGSLKS